MRAQLKWASDPNPYPYPNPNPNRTVRGDETPAEVCERDHPKETKEQNEGDGDDGGAPQAMLDCRVVLRCPDTLLEAWVEVRVKCEGEG